MKFNLYLFIFVKSYKLIKKLFVKMNLDLKVEEFLNYECKEINNPPIVINLIDDEEDKGNTVDEIVNSKKRKRDVSYLICPITRDFFKNPVVASDGYTYESEAIENYLKDNSVSPITKQPITNITFPNLHIKQAVEEYQVEYKKSKISIPDDETSSRIYKFDILPPLYTFVRHFLKVAKCPWGGEHKSGELQQVAKTKAAEPVLLLAPALRRRLLHPFRFRFRFRSSLRSIEIEKI